MKGERCEGEEGKARGGETVEDPGSSEDEREGEREGRGDERVGEGGWLDGGEEDRVGEGEGQRGGAQGTGVERAEASCHAMGGEQQEGERAKECGDAQDGEESVPEPVAEREGDDVEEGGEGEDGRDDEEAEGRAGKEGEPPAYRGEAKGGKDAADLGEDLLVAFGHGSAGTRQGCGRFTATPRGSPSS